jgi:hypothetical protein
VVLNPLGRSGVRAHAQDVGQKPNRRNGETMNVGDLVALRLCGDEGKIGVITDAPDPSYLGKKNPGLCLFWVLTDKGNQCYSGNQLIRHKWMGK